MIQNDIQTNIIFYLILRINVMHSMQKILFNKMYNIMKRSYIHILLNYEIQFHIGTNSCNFILIDALRLQ